MKRILFCTSVLGGGTALVFAAAALAATLAPAGALVPVNNQQFGVLRGVSGPVFGGGFGGVNVSTGSEVNLAVDMPAVAPAPVADPPVIVQPVSRGTP